MKIGLTGASGMIGRHMMAIFAQQGIDCIVVGRDQWDLSVWNNQLDILLGNVDVLFHFGAYIPKSIDGQSEATQTQVVFDANVRSCLNLGEWAQKNMIPLVFLSGSTVYADVCGQSIKEDAPNVINGFGGFYGYSKFLAEAVIAHFIASGLKAIILRPSSVYGVGLDSDKLIQRCLSLAMTDQPMTIWQAKNKINLVHAYDVAYAALSAYKMQAWGVYNIAAAEAVSVMNIVNSCIEICGSSSAVEIVDHEFSNNVSTRFNLDYTKAIKAFNYSPCIDLHKGLEMMFKGDFLPC